LIEGAAEKAGAVVIEEDGGVSFAAFGVAGGGRWAVPEDAFVAFGEFEVGAVEGAMDVDFMEIEKEWGFFFGGAGARVELETEGVVAGGEVVGAFEGEALFVVPTDSAFCDFFSVDLEDGSGGGGGEFV